MDEELNQEQQQQPKKSRSGGPINPAKGAANKLKNAQDSTKLAAEGAKKYSRKMAKKAAQKTGKAAVKASTRSANAAKAAANLGKLSAKFGKAAAMATKIGAILGWVFVIIIILIVVIGLLVFLITGLGFIMAGLKEVTTAFFEKCMEIAFGTANIVYDEEIIDTLSYLDEMGYDLYGYGFTTKDNALLVNEENETKRLAYAASDDAYRYICTYMGSDKYAYLIDYTNRNVFQLISDMVMGGTTWGEGAIEIFFDDGNIGVKGEPFNNRYSWSWERLTSDISVENGVLKINNPGIGTPMFTYNLDGWIGRYSMPLEFLLSTHLATMAPDLSYKMATSFDTKIELLLHQQRDEESHIDAKVITPEGIVIIKSDFEDLVTNWGWNWAEVASISKKDALKVIVELGIISQAEGIYECTGPGDGNGPTSTDNTMMFSDYVDRYRGGIAAPSQDTGETWEDVYSEFAKTVVTLGYVYSQDELGITESIGEMTFYSEINFANAEQTGENRSQTFDCTFTVGEETVPGTVTVTWSGFDGTGDQILESGKCYYTLERDYTDSEIEARAEGQHWFCHEVTHEELNDGTYDSACTGCRDYIRDIYSALNQTQVDMMGDYYIPYIFRVINHWYRNVYFTESGMEEAINEGNEGEDGDGSLISTDDEYEKKTAERWTEYEMYEENGVLQYELYVYLKYGGEYSTEFETENGQYVVCKQVDLGDGNYNLSDDGVTYVKCESGEKGEFQLKLKVGDGNYTACGTQPNEFRVGKKAKTQTFEDLKTEQGITSDKWMAYNPEAQFEGNDWEQLEVNESSPEAIRDLESIEATVWYLLAAYNVKQIEDGVRGQTNSTIKKLFLDDYYIFDGNGPRAALINKAKEMAGGSDDPDVFRDQYGEEEVIKVTYYENGEGEGKEYTATIDEISGPINLNQTSLSAFSILENMHTLDSEYIYRDFKELIVELNYFDKEDLSEAVDEVMMFPVSGFSANGWPVARYDVSEEFYGTLIHSAQDYEALKAETAAEIAEILSQVEEEEHSGGTQENDETEQETTNNNTEITSNHPLVLAARDVASILIPNGEYCQGTGNNEEGSNNRGHTSHHRATSLSELQSDPKTDCSGFVSICLQQVGILEEGSTRGSGNFSSLQGEIIDNPTLGELEPGMICVYSGHVNIYAGDGLYYDWGGRRESLPMSYSLPTKAIKLTGEMSYNGISGGSSQVDFPGYEGGEAVLSPVTGEVIKYGTTERKNIETGETDTVGFIKVRLLGPTERTPEEQRSLQYKFGGRNDEYYEDITNDDIEADNASAWLDNAYQGDERYTVGYDYFWEEYNYAGIGGTVVYIEGFDVADILGESVANSSDVTAVNLNARDNIEELADYVAREDTSNNYSTTYTVPNLLDDTREFELDIAEQAKQDAVDTLKKDGRIYIKEGAVIGKTYGQDDSRVTAEVELTDGNTYKIGNYMRIILRDEKGEVIENVEDYVDYRFTIDMTQ